MSIRIREIQQEMQQEAKIDKAIDAKVNKWLKTNKAYRKADSRKDATALLIFIRANLSRYNFVFNEKNNETLDLYEHDEKLTVIFLKNKNPHDNNKTTLGQINRNTTSSKKFYTTNDKIKYI